MSIQLLKPTARISEALAVLDHASPYVETRDGRRFFFEFFSTDPEKGVTVSEDAGGGRNKWAETVHPNRAARLVNVVREAWAQHMEREHPDFPRSGFTPKA